MGGRLTALGGLVRSGAMAATLDLPPDELLSTTRAVRKRLDLDRPVPLDLIKECLEMAQQAPTGSNTQGWQFMVVTDADKRAAIGEIYRRAFAAYKQMDDIYIGSISDDDPDRDAQQQRSASSADYLGDNMDKVPAMVIPCHPGRADGGPAMMAVLAMGNIIPAAWNFCPAARARGLGTCWTTLHLMFEEEAAAVLSIPFDDVQQVALLPVAYTKGTDFKAATRPHGRHDPPRRSVVIAI